MIYRDFELTAVPVIAARLDSPPQCQGCSASPGETTTCTAVCGAGCIEAALVAASSEIGAMCIGMAATANAGHPIRVMSSPTIDVMPGHFIAVFDAEPDDAEVAIALDAAVWPSS